jgi:hypothetical protein
MSDVKYHAPWHQLKKVCVGSTYHPNFYDQIVNIRVRESLQKIAVETEEDYQNLIKVLESFDIKVYRPIINDCWSILNFVDSIGNINYSQSQSFTLIPRPPMQPRDSFLIVGDQAILTLDESKWFLEFLPSSLTVSSIKFDAPLATVVGDTVIVDCRDHCGLGSYLESIIHEHKIVPVKIGGHNDAVFSVIGPGTIISTYQHTNYKETFPNWSVKYIENQSWNAIPEWRKLKHKNVGHWWSPEKNNNPEFENFVNAWLNNWVGFVEETVFDVNMLQINSHTILVNNYNQDLFNFFKQQKIDPVIVPFRHRFFWDGGLHCITNDLYREGTKENYV